MNQINENIQETYFIIFFLKIQREYIPIDLKIKIDDTYKLFEKFIPKMFLDSLNNLINDPNFILKKNWYKRKFDEVLPKKFFWQKINWNKTNIEIIRLINASSFPY